MDRKSCDDIKARLGTGRGRCKSPDLVRRWLRQGDSRSRLLVDDDGAMLIELDAGRFEAEAFRVRRAPGREEDDVGFNELSAGETNAEASVGELLDAADEAVVLDDDSAPPHLIAERQAKILIEAAED